VRAVDELSRAATARNSTRRVPHRREDRKTQLLSLSLSLSLFPFVPFVVSRRNFHEEPASARLVRLFSDFEGGKLPPELDA